MVAHHRFEEAKLWLKGVKENLARRPQGNDRAQVKAIYAGQWDISLGNSYYFGKMLANKEKQEWLEVSNYSFLIKEIVEPM